MSIVLERVTKRFGDLTVVDRVSLEVTEGELFVLLGASGSGKSTILRLIAGLAVPDDGRIVLNGKDVTSLPPQARGTGFVFQNYSIFRHMSVSRNVEFGLKVRKVPRGERRRKRDELLELVGLSGLGERYADQLSGGQQQRVALARALAYQPSVLLLDEPFGALDVKIRAQLRRSVKEIKNRLGVTTILVTHDQEEAFELADRIGVMDRARLVEVGTPEALYRSPRSLFVASFLGAGTVLVGRAEKGQAQFGSLSFDIPAETPHEEGAPVRCLFRPEEVVLTAEKPEGAAPVLGLGTISEQNFSGHVRRMRLLIPPVSGVRQAAPVVPFGAAGLLVDAILPAEAPIEAASLWVSLRAWHILREPAPQILLVDGGIRSSAALKIGRQLSEDMNASVTLLGIAGQPDETETLRASLKKRQDEAGLTRGEVRVRHGDPVTQVLNEQSESVFELTILAANDGMDGKRGRLSPTVVRLLERSNQPILVAKDEPRKIESILICTAAGEPGKSDVRVGGRLARLLRAKVTLLHVLRNTSDLQPSVLRHLDGAAATLRMMDLTVEVRTPRATNVLRGILEEYRRLAHDLIVVGSHGPQFKSLWGLDDVTRRVARGVPVSLLVVPAEEV